MILFQKISYQNLNNKLFTNTFAKIKQELKRQITMKKLTIILLILFGFNIANAQSGTEINFNQLKKKVEKSNADIENPKKNIKEGFWMDRAELFMEAYESQLYNASAGSDIATLKLLLGGQLKNSIQEEQEGVLVNKLITERTVFYFVDGKLEKWEVLNPVLDNPLEKSLACLKKAQEIDAAGKKTKKINELYIKLKSLFISEGSNCYSLKNYSCAFISFNNVILIGEMPQLNQKDTAIYYFSALSAQLAGKNQEAIELYKKSIELGYTSEGNIYANLDQSLKALGDTDSGLKYLEEGFAKYPKNQSLLIAIINYYLNKNEDPSKVLNYINNAIKDEPSNASLHHAKGVIYDKIGDAENAILAYQKAVETDPTYYDSYYNMGVVVYNKAVKYLEEANKVPAKEVEKYEAFIVKANLEFKNALPYFEKAYELKQNDKSTIETLKNIYFRFRNESEEMKNKFDSINAKLQSM